jgi:cysteine synthase
MGLSKRLKQYNSNIKIIATEPQENHKISGLKNLTESLVPDIYDTNSIDNTIVVQNENAYATTKKLALKEGLLVGISSGANLHSALEIANKIDYGNIVVIFPDRGEKYLSTDLFD